MGRWRPPSPTSSPYVTTHGLKRLKAELKDLWRVQRPEVVRALAAAAAEGDRSENAEYTYRKKQLGGIDRRIRYLSKRIDVLKPIEGTPSDPEKVFFGATVTVEDADGSEAIYRIVGPDEIDAAKSWISIDSPLARALLGSRLDDEVSVETPSGTRLLAIVGIDYPASEAG
ncbi:transcription elongation factor GreB [Wenzhouxiangella sp. XN79A]|nr:transcription elongation factor GreB [Wenzhouxiangella sp. XN79A]